MGVLDALALLGDLAKAQGFFPAESFVVGGCLRFGVVAGFTGAAAI